MSNANDNSTNDLDDLLSTNQAEDDIFAALELDPDASASQSIELETDDSPFSSDDDLGSDPFATGRVDSDPFATENVPDDASAPFATPVEEAIVPEGEPTDKKGKKAKKAKKEKPVKVAKKEKVAKEKPAKKAKAPKEPKGEYQGKPGSIYFLALVFLLIILAVNVGAFMTAGAGCVMFLIVFDVLGLLLLLIPFFLLGQLRKTPIGLFDMFLALAAAFAIMSCMAILTYQAKTYGSSTKVSTNVPSVVASFEC